MEAHQAPGFWHGVVEGLRGRGRELGFAAVGVAAAGPFPDDEAVLRRRRELGWETPFEEADLARRVDPRQLLPGVRAIVVVALAYHHPDPGRAPESAGPRGVVSRYAWGRDYHQVLEERLQALARFLEGVAPGTRTLVSVDTGPLLERSLAARAGLGSMGKNCCLILPGEGSFFFLGLLLTTAPLPATGAAGSLPPDACGTCDLCLRGCPTGALVEPGRLDPRRCLSYLTQMEGPIPEHLRPAMGRMVWGCDICQSICPHNRPLGRLAAGDPHLAPTGPERARPALIPLASLDSPGFRRRFGGSAAAWRGRQVLRRNALTALGNVLAGQGDAAPARALSVLRRALGDKRPTIRIHAAWALGRVGGPAARQALEAAPGQPPPPPRPPTCREGIPSPPGE